MNYINYFFWKCSNGLKSFINKAFVSPFRKSLCASCGKKVLICRKCKGNWNNVVIGNDVYINEGALLLSTRAKIIIGDHVMFGPNVTIITGNHKIDVVGKFMTEINDAEKDADNDKDVVLKGDNWIGANVTLLKGVTIGYGSVVGAGSIVTKDVPPFTIVGGCPAKIIGRRFDNPDLKNHIDLLHLEKELNV